MNRKEIAWTIGFVILIILDLLILGSIYNNPDKLTTAAVYDTRPEPTQAVLVMNGEVDAGSDLVRCCEIQGSEGKSCYSLTSSSCNACEEVCG